MIPSTDYDLLIIRQSGERIAGSHLTDEQRQQIAQDYRDWGNRPIDQDGVWVVAFANRDGVLVEITNWGTFPRSATPPHSGHAALRVIDGGKKDNIKVAVEVSVTVSTAQLAAA